MIKFYTSYFDNYNKLPENYQCVSIARFPPENFIHPPLSCNRINGDMLAPSSELLNKIKTNQISEEEYSKEYVKELAKSLEERG